MLSQTRPHILKQGAAGELHRKLKDPRLLHNLAVLEQLFRHSTPSSAVGYSQRDRVTRKSDDWSSAVTVREVFIELHKTDAFLLKRGGNHRAHHTLVEHLLPDVLVEVRNRVSQRCNPRAWHGKGRGGGN